MALDLRAVPGYLIHMLWLSVIVTGPAHVPLADPLPVPVASALLVSTPLSGPRC